MLIFLISNNTHTPHTHYIDKCFVIFQWSKNISPYYLQTVDIKVKIVSVLPLFQLHVKWVAET